MATSPAKARAGAVNGFAAIIAAACAAMSWCGAPALAKDDAYRPPADQPGSSLGTLQGQGYGGQGYGTQAYGGQAYGGQQGSGASSNPYGANTGAGDVYYPPQSGRPAANDTYRPPANDTYRPPAGRYGQGAPSSPDYPARPYDGPPDRPPPSGGGDYGEPYRPPSDAAPAYRDGGYSDRGPRRDRASGEEPPRASTYSQNEIFEAGHGFFGTVSQGLANVIEYAFKEAGRPNGYILGEDAGGAFFAGLRYGEGVLYTKDAGNHKVFWQGPSLGYDFGAEGSKTMVLVYNLRDPSDIYNRFGGVQGSAYVVGGVGLQFQKWEEIVLAPIRSGIGLRLGANVGYLKYTRHPTWNPF